MSESPIKPKRGKAAVALSNAVAPPPAKAAPALLTPTQEADAFMGFLERAATDPTIDVSKMRELLNLKKEILQEQRVAAFHRDFMDAKMSMPRIKKDGSVEYAIDKAKPDGPKREAFKFARYETIDKEIRPIEVKFGFSRSFTTTPRANGGGIIVHCVLLHREGHYKEAAIPVPLDSSGGKNNLQGYGSSFSYGKRYTTTMVWDLITEGEDDDGSSAFAGAPIDDAQFKAIQEIMEEWGIETPKFCAHLKVESLRAITNKQYPKAMADLKGYVQKITAAREKAAAKAAAKEGETK